MPFMKLLSRNLPLTKKLDIDYIFNLPCVHYVYPEVSRGEIDRWIQYDYAQKHNIESYARFLNLYHFFPDLAKEVSEYFQTVLPRYEFDFRKISITCTKGFVYPHKDGNNRTRIQMCARNTNDSKFFTSNENDYSLYETRKNFNRLKDGNVYLIKTATIHELIPKNIELPLFFYTYSFSENYEDLLNFL